MVFEFNLNVMTVIQIQVMDVIILPVKLNQVILVILLKSQQYVEARFS